MAVHVTPHLHHVLLTERGKVGDILRVSYLITLPFFTTVALITNLMLFCIFSTSRMKKYRCSVFFRFVSLVDMTQGLVTFGLMWLALAVPEGTCSSAERYTQCRMYTIFRYTVQDLSAYGLVCLLMERCSAMSTIPRTPSCLLVTICKFQWVLRHLPSKLFLLTVSMMTLTVNTGLVLAARHDLELPVFTDCFNTWKSPQDFTYDFRSLAMNHASLSIVIPSMSCLVSYFCLRMLVNRHRTGSLVGGCCLLNNYNTGTGRHPCLRRQHGHVTHWRWIHLRFPNTNTSNSNGSHAGDVTSGVAHRPLPQGTFDVRPSSTAVSIMSVDDVSDENSQGSRFLDRLYALIKRREMVLSVVYVEDSRLAAEPPPGLNQELNAMASISALFFILLMQPQILLLATGCVLGKSMDWSLMKNMGLATDLIANNRISFTLFLYLFVSGKRLSNVLILLLENLYTLCCPCLSRTSPHAGNPILSQARPRIHQPITPPPCQVHLQQVEGHDCGYASVPLPLCPSNLIAEHVSHQGQQDVVMPKVSIMTPC